MTMTTETTPRVWIACLAAYNDGILHGRWVDVTDDPADLHDAIKTTLEASPIEGADGNREFLIAGVLDDAH